MLENRKSAARESLGKDSGLRKLHFFPTTISTPYHIKIYIRCGEMLGGLSAWGPPAHRRALHASGASFSCQNAPMSGLVLGGRRPIVWHDTALSECAGASIQIIIAR